MTPEEFYEEIGRAAAGLAPDREGKLLVYAEVEDGVISADVFYTASSGKVFYREAPESLSDLIYDFWEASAQGPDGPEWRTMTYILDGTKFSIDFQYPDQMDEEEETSDRRPRVLKSVFGDAKVDYSSP